MFDFAGVHLGKVHCKLFYGNRQDAVIPDFDGDGKDDVGQFSHADGRWDMMPSSGACPARWKVREVHNGRNICGTYFGFGTDAPAAADYDGDGIADLGFWRQQNELLMITPSSGVCPGHVPYYTVWDGFSLCARAVTTGTSVPIPADYDGDGKKDVAQYTPSTGLWTVVPSSNQCPSRVRENQNQLIDGWTGCSSRFGDPTDVPIR